MPDSLGRGSWDEGARYDADVDPNESDPLRGMWVDGRPAKFATPERQHVAVLTRLIDSAAREPRRQW